MHSSLIHQIGECSGSFLHSCQCIAIAHSKVIMWSSQHLSMAPGFNQVIACMVATVGIGHVIAMHCRPAAQPPILSFFDLKFMHMIKNLEVGLAKKLDKSKENYWHYFPKPSMTHDWTSGQKRTVHARLSFHAPHMPWHILLPSFLSFSFSVMMNLTWAVFGFLTCVSPAAWDLGSTTMLMFSLNHAMFCMLLYEMGVSLSTGQKHSW